MIDFKEIRCGNWFTHKPVWSHRNEERKEFQFQWGLSDFYAEMECLMSFEDCEPIPLTPEVLVKCGWKVSGDDARYRDLYFYFDENGTFRPYEYYTSQAFEEAAWPKYLHQLQNVVYFLTGQELNYTP